MTLDELILELSSRNPGQRVKNGFGSGHSDRGDYSNAAFSPVSETTIGEMLRHAKELKNTDQTGYKGGRYLMAGYVSVLIGEWGDCGEYIGKHHFLYWDCSAPNVKDDRAGASPAPSPSPCWTADQ